MTSSWRPLPDRLGHVRLDGPRPALRTGTGEFLRLHGVPDGGRRAYLREVASFARERAAQQRDERWPEGRRRVTVLGRDRLSTQVATALRRLGADVRRLRRPAHDHKMLATDLLVAVSERPDVAGDAATTWLAALPARGIAVLHGHPDGDGFLLMPLRIDGTEACADQVRRRRLAASPAADELRSWLAEPRRCVLTPSVRALVTAQIADAASAWAAGDEAAAELRHTLTVTHPDLRLSRHVVLGFDEPAQQTTA